jgi:hypothetical protein
MDMSGSMPRAAWVEIRDEADELLVSIPAEINGGSVSAELPAFPKGAMGTIQLCTQDDETVYRDPAEVQELPAGPQLLLVHLG